MPCVGEIEGLAKDLKVYTICMKGGNTGGLGPGELLLYSHRSHRHQSEHLELGLRLHLRLPEEHTRQHGAADVRQDSRHGSSVADADHGGDGAAPGLALEHQARLPVGPDGVAVQQHADKGDDEGGPDEPEEAADGGGHAAPHAGDAPDGGADGRLDQRQADDVDEDPDGEVLHGLRGKPPVQARVRRAHADRRRVYGEAHVNRVRDLWGRGGLLRLAGWPLCDESHDLLATGPSLRRDDSYKT